MKFIKLRLWQNYDLEEARPVWVRAYSISHMRVLPREPEPATMIQLPNGSVEVLETPEQILALCEQDE